MTDLPPTTEVPERSVDQRKPTPTSGRRRTPRATDAPAGLSTAFLTQPSVQAVRFLQKLVLVNFLRPPELGEANFAGLVTFAWSQAAAWGIDQFAVVSPEFGSGLVRSLQRRLVQGGLLVTMIAAAASFSAPLFEGNAELRSMLLALAPVVFISNLGVIPTALLVRHQKYRRLFAVDFGAAALQATATILAVELGMGSWAVVVGWYVSQIVTTFGAMALSRDLVPRDPEPEPDLTQPLATGRHFMGATLSAFASERFDSVVVRKMFGAGAFGAYDMALHLSQSFVNYAANLAQRFLFPTLAAAARAERRESVLKALIPKALLLVVPASGLLAVCASVFVTRQFDGEWLSVKPIVVVSCFTAGARCFDLLGMAVLKSSGQARPVFYLEILKSVVLAVAVGIGLMGGVIGVAYAVLSARAVGAAMTWYSARRVTSLPSGLVET